MSKRSMSLQAVGNIAVAALAGVIVVALVLVYVMQSVVNQGNRNLEYAATMMYAADRNFEASKYNAIASANNAKAARDNIQATENIIVAAERAFPESP